MQGHVARSEYAQVSVQGHDALIFLHGQGGPHGNGFLSNPAKPFADPSMPEQDKHFFFGKSGQQQAFVNMDQLFVGYAVTGELHGTKFIDKSEYQSKKHTRLITYSFSPSFLYKSEVSMERSILNRRAHQKPSTPKPGTNLLASRI